MRLLVLERDGFICQLCGRDGANSVDHIQPKARGGSDSLDNLRAAHSWWNSVVGGTTRRPGREGVRPFRDPAQTHRLAFREKNPVTRYHFRGISLEQHPLPSGRPRIAAPSGGTDDYATALLALVAELAGRDTGDHVRFGAAA